MWSWLTDPLNRLFKNGRSHPGTPLDPGLYHFKRETPPAKTRLHLRVDPDGHGTLVINANQIVHLNPTAAYLTYLHLEGRSPEEIKSLLSRSYPGQAEDFQEDVANITGDVESFIQANGKAINPLSEIDFQAPYSLQPSAPYRMDLALTYRCNNDCPHCYNARERSFPELDTATWKKIIARLWDLNIPHLIFTGGEPTLRDDLPELIRYAEQRGQITGLNTNGRRLSDPGYIQQLIKAGLDHVQITLESHQPQIHDQMVNLQGAWEQTTAGIRNAVSSSLFVMTNTTMLQHNQDSLGETLAFLAELGVPTVGLNALIHAGRGKHVGTGLSEQELNPLLEMAQEETAAAGQKLIWYTPTLYCRFNPLERGLGVKGCTAALYNMCLEPDGGVLPCQSYYQQLGNILSDPWDQIWEHELARQLRNRHYLPEACHSCHLVEECGAGCPLALAENLPLIQPVLPSPI